MYVYAASTMMGANHYQENPTAMNLIVESKVVQELGKFFGGGKDTKAKVGTAAVFTGIAAVAKETPFVREALMAYAGGRLGSLAGEGTARKFGVGKEADCCTSHP